MPDGAGVPAGAWARWALALGTDDAPRGQRRLGENVRWFGTPLAVNLEVCPGARAARLDRALRSWTGGRLRCRPVAPAWWVPPSPRSVLDRWIPRAAGRS